MGSPFAVFDIDGTILRWQLYHAVVDELYKAGKLDKQSYQRVRDSRMDWKKRIHQASYVEYELELVKFFETAITGITPDELIKASKSVFDSYKDQVYTYTRDLIKQLRRDKYLLFAISASQDRIVGLMAAYYGFDDYGGSVYEQKDGMFTGQGKILKSESKPRLLKQLVKKHSAIWEGSVAVGDSESDIPMLSTVEQPIAFNPTKNLYEHAKKHGWRVVVERKNVIYELEQDASILAKTDSR